VAEGVFLSPRVLDRGAFEEYSARLRALLEQVAAQGLALRSSSADAERLVAALRAQFADRSEALESASRLAQSMNERLVEARNILGKAGDLAGLAADFDARTQRIIDDKIAAVERRFSEIIERFGKSTQERVQQAATQAAAAAEQARAERDETRRMIETIARPATQALTDQVTRAEALVATGAGGLGDMAQLAQRLGEASIKAELNIAALKGASETAATTVRGLQTSLDAAVEFSDRLVAQNTLASGDIGDALAS
jgi:ABC-type transporter Mla subunit MlaD